MKQKLRYLIIMVLSLVSFAGCNYLDFDETNALGSRESMYETFARTNGMLTNVYSHMPQGLYPISTAMRDCGSDDAEYADPSGTVQIFNNGNWSSIQTVDAQWGLYYGIRDANEFIESVENIDFSRFENNTSYEWWCDQLQYYPYEARVLRAYYIFELARRYGDIAMPLKMLTTSEAGSIEKTSFEDVVKFIVAECDECAPNLPYTFQDVSMKETGRMTKGFAMALKAKVLLYAASPLHNTAGDTSKWEDAARAAFDVIQLVNGSGAPVYSLDGEATVNNLKSKEVIMFKMNGNSSYFELNNFPFRFTEGQRSDLLSSTFPTQNLVDAFQTMDGYSVTLDVDGWVSDDPLFDPQRPYVGRDPRFAKTILANGMDFKDSEIELFAGGADDVSMTNGGTPTGYFLRKYIQETTSFTPGAEVSAQHHWIIFRLAEAYLSFAEAMVEAYGTPTSTSDEFGAEYTALWALNKVRQNAGMPNAESTPAYKNINTKDGFVNALRDEWRVEFAFEDHRFWDVRRWKIAGQLPMAIGGVSIEKDGDVLSFSRKTHKTRVWNDRMYLYPIPQSELFKNSNLNPQNTGW